MKKDIYVVFERDFNGDNFKAITNDFDLWYLNYCIYVLDIGGTPIEKEDFYISHINNYYSHYEYKDRVKDWKKLTKKTMNLIRRNREINKIIS